MPLYFDGKEKHLNLRALRQTEVKEDAFGKKLKQRNAQANTFCLNHCPLTAPKYQNRQPA
jgi:hypothetical protein